MVLIISHVAHIVVSLVHGPEIEEDVRVECTVGAKLAAKVRLGLFNVEAELVAGAHSPNPLLAYQFRCLIYVLSSEGSLDNLRSKLNLHSLVIH